MDLADFLWTMAFFLTGIASAYFVCRSIKKQLEEKSNCTGCPFRGKCIRVE